MDVSQVSFASCTQSAFNPIGTRILQLFHLEFGRSCFLYPLYDTRSMLLLTQCRSSIVEATIVIFVGSLPRMPQFLKVVLRRNKKNAYIYPSAKQLRRESRGHPKKASNPFSSVSSNNGSSWQTRNGSSSLVPLKELELAHGTSFAAAGGAETEDMEQGDPQNSIRKTVRMENTGWEPRQKTDRYM